MTVAGTPSRGEDQRIESVPQTQYAKNGGVHVAYQIVGDGDLDLLVIDSWVHHVELFWEFPDLARQLRRLSAIGRLIRFDRRGTGLSDPVPLDRLPDLETQVADVCAVMDASGCTQAAILGFTDGGPLALLLAASHPERCRALVLFNTAARLTSAEDYPWGAPEEFLLEVVDRQSESWATGSTDLVPLLAPSPRWRRSVHGAVRPPLSSRSLSGCGRPLFPPVGADRCS